MWREVQALKINWPRGNNSNNKQGVPLEGRLVVFEVIGLLGQADWHDDIRKVAINLKHPGLV